MFHPFYIEYNGERYLVIGIADNHQEFICVSLLSNQMNLLNFNPRNGPPYISNYKFIGLAKVSDFEISLDSDKLAKKQ